MHGAERWGGPGEEERGTDGGSAAAAQPAPLAARMRPRSLDEYAGQTHLLGPGQLLRRAIESDRIQSLIFYGPPGTGKTSLAQIIPRHTKSKFERPTAVEPNRPPPRPAPSPAPTPHP